MLAVEGVLSVLCGARDVVARASRVPLDDAGCDTLADVIDVASRLRSAADAVVLSARECPMFCVSGPVGWSF